MNIPARPKAIDDWFATLLDIEEFQIKDYTLQLSRQWSLENGFIRHCSGRFFSIIGLEAIDLDGQKIVQPMIDQREIGTLGMIVKRDVNELNIYIQAKVEPGNIGLIQLAPSCQATASNADRVHGGSAPLFLEYFKPGSDHNVVADSLQSEQGTRFYGKFNRNCMVEVGSEINQSPYHRWMTFTELAPLLVVDHMINTDARSTLVSSPWELLAKEHPFSTYQNGFGRDLMQSYDAEENQSLEKMNKIKLRLDSDKAKWVEEPKIIPLDDLDEWEINDRGIKPKSGWPFQVEQIKVRANSREISTWDQPIINSAGLGQIILLCGRWNRILHFLFKESIEPGFIDQIELTPAGIVAPGEKSGLHPFIQELTEDTDAQEIISCRQSEEGGRFLRDENIYIIMDTGKINTAVPENFHWLTLKQVKRLIDEGQRLTNEARSAVSLLLCWLC